MFIANKSESDTFASRTKALEPIRIISISKINTMIKSLPTIQGGARLPSRTCIRPTFSLHAFKKDAEKSGIHDPSGPVGEWGSGNAKSKQQFQAQEEKFAREQQHMAAENIRAEQRLGGHSPGHTTVNKIAAVDAEFQEVAKEKAADDEYAHMGRLEKLFMEAKGVLYSWLKTGVEPL